MGRESHESLTSFHTMLHIPFLQIEFYSFKYTLQNNRAFATSNALSLGASTFELDRTIPCTQTEYGQAKSANFFMKRVRAIKAIKHLVKEEQKS